MKRVLLALALTTPLLVALPATAAATTVPAIGHLDSAVLNTFTHRLTVKGWAYDPSATSTSVMVRVVVDGTYLPKIIANQPSPGLDSVRHLTGAHRFTVTVAWTTTAKTAVLKSRGAHLTAPLVQLASLAVTRYYPPPGVRIITIAKRYVGYPYVEGGASPSGFDCSGYTLYAYEKAHVKNLPHNAESQREAMRLLSRSTARPGDLVFYMSGGTAYHVAIYAGSGWQYAAATPADGVRFQRVWSSAVQYRTDWH
ncbi:MAG TPA: C40 family peptidase [Jatrophihabitantaceae bacterium]|nr:C40 family peptidase [Jatrophihabitantaceae bacterium]